MKPHKCFLRDPHGKLLRVALSQRIDLSHPLVKLAECGSGPCSMLRSSRLNGTFSSDEPLGHVLEKRSLSGTLQTRCGVVSSFGTRITSDLPVQNLSPYWPITLSASKTAF
jgi:hypothetical protein